MDNKFFKFVETYWTDIEAFFNAIIEFFKTVIGKLGEEETQPEA